MLSEISILHHSFLSSILGFQNLELILFRNFSDYQIGIVSSLSFIPKYIEL